jgi:spore germination protein GerM
VKRGRVIVGAFILAAVTLSWLLFRGLPRWYSRTQPQTATAPAATQDQTGRTIKARLFYVSADGMSLTSVETDVPYADGPTDQARRIVEAQIAPVADPLVSAIPAGTKLRDLFVASGGRAYVNLSPEISAMHPHGATDELLTVYTIVDALTENLPAISAVQILVDGKEIDTLAGHVDLRRPLAKDLEWVAQTGAREPSARSGKLEPSGPSPAADKTSASTR